MKHKAILLVGPTGAGKTPLGDFLEWKRLWGRRCAHFDFGANLRRIGAGGAASPALSSEDVAAVLDVLGRGALLEDEHFYLAKKILDDFVNAKELGKDDIVVLNGLPRHAGQARDVDSVVSIMAVVFLNCSPGAIVERIRRDTDGDRAGRVDDSPRDVAKKVKTFEDRTIPLLDHYRQKGVRIVEVPVGVQTRPEDIWKQIEKKRPGS